MHGIQCQETKSKHKHGKNKLPIIPGTFDSNGLVVWKTSVHQEIVVALDVLREYQLLRYILQEQVKSSITYTR